MEKTSKMEKFELIKGYFISKIITGCWQFSLGHGTVISQEKEIENLNEYVASGMTTFDCADIYSGVEEFLGKFLQQCKGEIQIHTKFVPDLDMLANMNKEYVERIINRSLQRLGVKTLDLVQFHWWDFDIPGYVQTAKWLSDLQKRGKIKHLGVTNFDVPYLKEITNSGVKIISNQVQYSLLDQRPEYAMVSFCKENDIKLICYGTLSGGFLSSKYLGMPEPQDPMENRSLTKYKLIINDIGGWNVFQELLQVLDSVSKKHNASISNVATRFILEKPQVAAAIIGYNPSVKVSDTLSILDFCLDKEDYKKIENVLMKFSPLPKDIYSVERIKKGKHAQIMKYNLNDKK